MRAMEGSSSGETSASTSTCKSSLSVQANCSESEEDKQTWTTISFTGQAQGSKAIRLGKETEGSGKSSTTW